MSAPPPPQQPQQGQPPQQGQQQQQPQGQPRPANQQQQQSGGRGSGGGRGRGYSGGGGRGRGGGSGGGGISLNPNSGIPYGHVPAYLPGSASLVEQLDQKVLVVLRDGKHIVGFLTSFDQFSNMILQDAVERRCYTSTKDKVTYYHDIPLGVYVIRGDSMVLLGNISEHPAMMMYPMKHVTLDELEEQETADKKEQTTTRDEPLTWDFDTDLIA